MPATARPPIVLRLMFMLFSPFELATGPCAGRTARVGPIGLVLEGKSPRRVRICPILLARIVGARRNGLAVAAGRRSTTARLSIAPGRYADRTAVIAVEETRVARNRRRRHPVG